MSLLRSSPITPETLLGGRYKLIEQLGAGGFGQTFIAEDLHLPGHPRCVLKRLQPQITDPASFQTAKRLFDSEAQVLYQLGNHDQIPRLLAHFEHEQEFYLAQDLVVGETLTKELIVGQPWPEAQVVDLLQDLLGVLAFVHQQEVIHRDIKPANLMRRRHDRRIVLIDFGAVKQVNTQLTYSSPGVTQTIVIGTPGYMPNEQLAGNPRFSSDVYAVGMVGIHALTGISPKSLPEDPYTGEICWRDAAPQVSEALAAVLDKMTRYDFRARYATAEAASAAIAPLASAYGTLLPTPTTLPQPPTVQWAFDTSSASSASTQSPSLAQISRAITKPFLNFHPASVLSSTPLTGFNAICLSTLTKLKQLPRKQVLPLAGLVVIGVGGVIAFTKPLPFSQMLSQLQSGSTGSSAGASPSPSPDPIAQAKKLLTEANQLRERQKFSEASNVYKQALALNAKLPEAHWGNCYSLNVLGKFKDALAACDAALKLNPTYAEALWSKGYALDRQDQDQDALILYERATTLKPDLVEAWNNKGTVLLQLQRPEEALTSFEQATRRNPKLASAWNGRGAALWRLGRYDEAIASVDQALQIQPNYQPALSLRKEMRQRSGLSSSENSTQNINNSASNSENRAPASENLTPVINNSASSSENRVLRSENRIPSSETPVLRIENRIPISKDHVLRIENPIPIGENPILRIENRNRDNDHSNQGNRKRSQRHRQRTRDDDDDD